MPMNRIQFQKGLSLPAFMALYGDEAQCVEALTQLRWLAGFVCPTCQHRHASTFQRKQKWLWQCSRCRFQASLTSGTVLANTKLPLHTWWLAIYLITQAKNGIAGLELARTLGVCYRTAWRIKHKLMTVMHQQEATHQLHDEVQIDDAYLGGERAGGPGEPQWQNKVPMIAAVSTKEGRPIAMRLDVLSNFRADTVHAWAQVALAADASVVSDGLSAFNGIRRAGVPHEAIICGSGRRAAQQPRLHWVNTLLGNLKTAFSGTFHAIKFAKYAQRYLDAHAYRFNRRFDMAAMVRQLAAAVMQSKSADERQLREPS